MAKIREDLVGVVYLDDGRKLAAGDTVPDGVELGEHVVAKSQPRASSKAGAGKGGDGGSGDQS